MSEELTFNTLHKLGGEWQNLIGKNVGDAQEIGQAMMDHSYAWKSEVVRLQRQVENLEFALTEIKRDKLVVNERVEALERAALELWHSRRAGTISLGTDELMTDLAAAQEEEE